MFRISALRALTVCAVAGGAVGAIQALLLALVVALAGAEESRELSVVAPFVAQAIALHVLLAALFAPVFRGIAQLFRRWREPSRSLAPIAFGALVAIGGLVEANIGRWDRSPLSPGALFWDLGALALGLACAFGAAWVASRWRRRVSRPMVLPAGALAGIMALGLLGGRLGGSIASDATDPPPNLLFLAVDTLRADHLSCHGYGRSTSPNIDRLAAEGANFMHAAAHSSATGPSHASLMTSTPLIQHGVLRNGDRLAAARVSLAEILRDQGYATAGFSTNGVIGLETAFDQGFETYFSSRSKHAVHEWAAAKSDPTQWLLRLPLPRLLRLVRGGDVVSDAAISWLRRRGRAAPFFLWVQWLDPHSPYDPEAAQLGRFSDPAAGAIDGSHETLEAIRRGDRIPTDEEIEHLAALYDEEIAQVDTEIGRVLRVLEDEGLSRSTVVVLWADHGENMYEHHADHGGNSERRGNVFFHSRQLYESLLHVPLIVRWPERIQAGLEIDTPCATIDIAPTILELLDLPPLPSFGGVSLAPSLRQEPRPELPMIAELYHLDSKTVSVRYKSWKLIRSWTAAGVRDELYNLSADPNELENLTGAGRSIEAELVEALIAWGEAHGLREFLEAGAGTPETEEDSGLRGLLESLGYI